MQFRIIDGKPRRIEGKLRQPAEVFSGGEGLASLPFLEQVQEGAEGAPQGGAEVQPSVKQVLAWIEALGIQPTLDAFSNAELGAELAKREKESYPPEETAPVIERLKAAYSTLAEFNGENGVRVQTWNGAAVLILNGSVQLPS